MQFGYEEVEDNFCRASGSDQYRDRVAPQVTKSEEPAAPRFMRTITPRRAIFALIRVSCREP
jgi:hypothetical protein